MAKQNAITSPQRRSKRDRNQLPSAWESSLQDKLERAEGGTKKILSILTKASKTEIEQMNTTEWSPLVAPLFRLGGKTTRKKGNTPQSEQELIQLINACHEKGVLVNSGAWFGYHYHRPLVLAAYYGFPNAVRRMLELGALPDNADGEGRTAWHAALQNPVPLASECTFRECDKITADVLLDMGVVTTSVNVWKERNDGESKGSTCYINGDNISGSPMYSAVRRKNVELLKYLVEKGSVLSDCDCIMLTIEKKIKSRLLPMVVRLQEGSNGASASGNINNQHSWSTETDWSFPPSWKKGVHRTRLYCGLPADIFDEHVIPFLTRDWFYSDGISLPPKMGASMGGRNMFSRDANWADR